MRPPTYARPVTLVFQILAVLSLMACGFLARRRRWLTGAGTSELARILVNLVYPALIFTTIPRLSVRDLAGNLAMPLMAMLIALTGLLLGLATVRLLRGASRRAPGSFLFQCVFGNYLFLPLPLVLLLWGTHGVALLVFSSLGFELLLWTVGVFLLARERSFGERLRSLLNPSFCSLLLATALVLLRDLAGWRGGGVPPAGWAAELMRAALFTAERLGEATIAISMLVAGSRMATLRPAAVWNASVWLAAAVRLVLVPLLVLLFLPLFPLAEVARGVLVVVAVMPCAVISVVFSERFGGDGELIAGTLLLTHVWAAVTVPLFLAWAL